MRRWILPAALMTLVALATPVLARFGLQEPVTDAAHRITGVYAQIFIAGLIVFVFVMVLLVYILVRYREKSGKGRATFEHERDNLKAEATWTIIPLIIVLWVGFISYQALVDLDNMDGGLGEPYTTVDITGFQWFWLAEYPDSGVSVSAIAGPQGQLDRIEPIVVPADVPVTFRLTSGDVIHSFNIQALLVDGKARGFAGGTLDANPGSINEMTRVLPEGDYFTQCKEHCLNPGHGYMRALVKAVPVAEYEEWIEMKLAGAAAGLTHHIPVAATGGALSTTAPELLGEGATVRFQFGNDEAEEQTFTLSGVIEDELTVGAGDLATVEYALNATGILRIEGSAGGSLELTVVEPRTIQIDMGNFFFDPEETNLEVGQVYVFEVTNLEGTHNAFIGVHDSEGERQIIWKGADSVAAGNVDLFLVTPETPGTWTIWCDIPGHYGLGMHGTVTIS